MGCSEERQFLRLPPSPSSWKYLPSPNPRRSPSGWSRQQEVGRSQGDHPQGCSEGTTLPTHREREWGQSLRALVGGAGVTKARQRGFPTSSAREQGPGGVTSQTRTPREPLLRLLEWGEPLRSRDTCFRTSAATVLRGQKGATGDTNTGAVGPRELHFGPINPFSETKIQAVEGKNQAPDQENLGFRIHGSQPRGPRTTPKLGLGPSQPPLSTDGRNCSWQSMRVTDPSLSVAPTKGLSPGWPAPWSPTSAPSSGGPASTLPPIQNMCPVPPLLWGFGQVTPASEPQFIHLYLKFQAKDTVSTKTLRLGCELLDPWSPRGHYEGRTRATCPQQQPRI